VLLHHCVIFILLVYVFIVSMLFCFAPVLVLTQLNLEFSLSHILHITKHSHTTWGFYLLP